MSRFWIVTAVLALLAGVAAAWLLHPVWRESRTLNAIASTDAEERAKGWRWLGELEATPGPRRAESRLKAINEHLAGASNEALLDGAARLESWSLWNWDLQDRDLVWRELALRARSVDDQLDAADSLAECPLDADSGDVVPVAQVLLGSPSADVRRAAFEAVCGWAGRDRPAHLRALPVSQDDSDVLRSLYLVLARCRPATRPGVDPLPTDEGILEAMMLWEVAADPEDAGPVLAHIDDGPLASSGVVEYVLRYSRDRRAARALERRAEGGSDVARFALQALARSVDEAQARRVANDPAQPVTTRRLAAWRWDRLPPDLAAAIAELDPAESDGSVLCAVLLAERRLTRPDAATLAERWIRSFDDDEKRAGALLAALLGEHASLLERAYAIEDIDSVRTAQRLALWALGRPMGGEDPLEFAHRTRHGDRGDFRGDTALCMLIAGRAETLEVLTSRPTIEPLSVRKRAWLIERFVPQWHEEVGRPIGGSRRALLLHFDSLDALRLVTWRRLRFDAASRTFRAE